MGWNKLTEFVHKIHIIHPHTFPGISHVAIWRQFKNHQTSVWASISVKWFFRIRAAPTFCIVLQSKHCEILPPCDLSTPAGQAVIETDSAKLSVKMDSYHPLHTKSSPSLHAGVPPANGMQQTGSRTLKRNSALSPFYNFCLSIHKNYFYLCFHLDSLVSTKNYCNW